MNLIYYSRISAVVAATALATATSYAGTIFQHNFENAPNPGTAVTAVADLGTPAVGSFSFSGSPVGGIGGNRQALAVGNAGNIANMTQMATNSVAFTGVFPETMVADSGGGDLVYVDFASPGEFTAGANTEISFNMASFGNNNTGQFKYQFVRGLDAADNEVFEMLIVSGSGQAQRQVYARGALDDSTTLAAANNGTPDGQLLADTFTFGLNGTNVANGSPSGLYEISILLEDGMVTYDIGATGGSVNQSAVNGTALPVNSAATSISRLEFSSVWNSAVDGQNKGYWVDNIVATTIPEPASGMLLLAAFLGIAVRRRG